VLPACLGERRIDGESKRQHAKVDLSGAVAADSEPLLTTDRADLVISTFTYTTDRDMRIDFSRAYYKAAGRLLVKNESPIQSLAKSEGQAGRDDERLNLRPVDEELLPTRA